MNTDDWNPATNGNLPANYHCHDMGGKAFCKECLQKELDLPVRPDVPLVAFIGRLDSQKGADLILEVNSRLCFEDISFSGKSESKTMHCCRLCHG